MSSQGSPSSGEASAGNNFTVGGLTLESWQLVVWVLAGAVFAGVLLALMAAYFNYSRERKRIGPLPVYSKNSIAVQRERLISTIRDLDFLQSVKQMQRRKSIMREQFLASQRAGRRFALAGSSMIAQFGSMWQNPLQGSLRSGVSEVSTPEKTPTRIKEGEFDGSTDSMRVELGEYDSDDGSVRSGVSYVQTPLGSIY